MLVESQAGKIREPFNALSHFVGAVLALVGTGYLVYTHGFLVGPTIALSIFGVAAMLMFGASSLYHWTPMVKPALRKFDHSTIYLMIAGSYTPMCLLSLSGQLRWVILGLEWTLAAIGIFAALTMDKPPTWLRLTLYLVMGWMILPVLGFVSRGIPSTAIAWMVAGGLFYTVGSVIYAIKKPNFWPGVFGFHELWHLFVLGGFACHFAMMTQI